MARRGQGDHGRRLSDEDRAEIERRIAACETQEDVAVAVGCDVRTVIRWVVRNGGLRSYERRRSPLRLSLAELEEIALGLAAATPARAIAGRIGRVPSTVTRELANNGGREGYRACDADARALERARRPKIAKLVRCPRLQAAVAEGLPRPGRRSRSQPGWGSTIPTTRRCACRTLSTPAES